jgi:hypothetical protein
MTQENAKDFLPLVEALAKGNLQAKFKNGWRDLLPGEDVHFAAPITHYRIRPKKIDLWVVFSMVPNTSLVKKTRQLIGKLETAVTSSI